MDLTDAQIELLLTAADRLNELDDEGDSGTIALARDLRQMAEQ